MLADDSTGSTTNRADFNDLVVFHQKFMSLHDQISQTISLFCEYWEEYLKPKPGIYWLFNISRIG